MFSVLLSRIRQEAEERAEAVGNGGELQVSNHMLSKQSLPITALFQPSKKVTPRLIRYIQAWPFREACALTILSTCLMARRSLNDAVPFSVAKRGYTREL
jgi:hypothetical protein